MSDLSEALDRIFAHSKGILRQKPEHALPDPNDVAKARAAVVSNLPDHELPLRELANHLLGLTAGLSNSSLSSTYYGFVTGGLTAPARLAELLTSLYDQNVVAHLPEQSIVTDVEDRALLFLEELLELDPGRWKGRNFTTGATASNIQGLALGRESIINRRLGHGQSVGELGLLSACKAAGIEEIKILSTNPHSSLLKGASILGLGRGCYVDVRRDDQAEEQLAIDFERLEAELRVSGRASIVAVSCGEVNTGNFATSSADELKRLRVLCDTYGAWLHVDGAFGIFARLLKDSTESGAAYQGLANGTQGIELADSIAGDLHKFLNVPYDCGFFLCHEPGFASAVYTNPNASYLKPGSLDIPSPLNIRAENSTRFRGFAVYSTLVGLGRRGYIRILQNQVDLARNIAQIIDEDPNFELLNGRDGDTKSYQGIFMIVLFRATDPVLNSRLTSALNEQRKLYVSGTMWENQPACRLAVSNWQANQEDLKTVRSVLEAVDS